MRLSTLLHFLTGLDSLPFSATLNFHFRGNSCEFSVVIWSSDCFSPVLISSASLGLVYSDDVVLWLTLSQRLCYVWADYYRCQSTDLYRNSVTWLCWRHATSDCLCILLHSSPLTFCVWPAMILDLILAWTLSVQSLATVLGPAPTIGLKSLFMDSARRPGFFLSLHLGPHSREHLVFGPSSSCFLIRLQQQSVSSRGCKNARCSRQLQTAAEKTKYVPTWYLHYYTSINLGFRRELIFYPLV